MLKFMDIIKVHPSITIMCEEVEALLLYCMIVVQARVQAQFASI